jgi:ribosomal protein S18 acetylase RimI-like enzyme
MINDIDGLMRLQKSQIKPASEMLARSFYDDPLFVFFFPDTSHRKNLSPLLFQFWLHHAIPYGKVYATSGNMEGIAVWFSSKSADRTLWRMILSGSFLAYLRLDKELTSKRHRINDFCETVRKKLTPDYYWYLEFIGILPQFRGNGYASSLIKPILARLDMEQLPCYLETENENNVPIYQHYGFDVVEKAAIPGTRLSLYAMLRKS